MTDTNECGGGGAILVATDVGASVMVSGSTFVGNQGFCGGGIGAMSFSVPSATTSPVFQLFVDSSTFLNNTAGVNPAWEGKCVAYPWFAFVLIEFCLQLTFME